MNQSMNIRVQASSPSLLRTPQFLVFHLFCLALFYIVLSVCVDVLTVCVACVFVLIDCCHRARFSFVGSNRLPPPRAKFSSQGMCPCIRVQLEAFANSNWSKTSLVARCSLGWSKAHSVVVKRSLNKYSSKLAALVTSGSSEVSTTPLVGNDKIGVLLLNLGGPETLDDVQPFLFNLFADPDIIRLPRLFSFLQRPLAQFISVVRSPKSKEGYAPIGGGSPLRRITDAQA